MSKYRNGFTLVELLIVIAIIGIMFVGADLLYSGQVSKGYDAVRKKDLNNLKIAFEHYYSDHLCYPTASMINNCNGTDLMPYLDKIPCDPQTHQSYSLVLDNTISCAVKYEVFATLTNPNDPQIVCNGRYAVFSENIGHDELVLNCNGKNFCSAGYYGCIQGQCVLVSAVSKPACAPVFCTADCQASCGLSGWDLSPQPCNP